MIRLLLNASAAVAVQSRSVLAHSRLQMLLGLQLANEPVAAHAFKPPPASSLAGCRAFRSGFRNLTVHLFLIRAVNYDRDVRVNFHIACAVGGGIRFLNLNPMISG